MQLQGHLFPQAGVGMVYNLLVERYLFHFVGGMMDNGVALAVVA